MAGGVKDAVNRWMQPVSAASEDGPRGDAEGKVSIPESPLRKGRCFVLTGRRRRCEGSIVLTETLRKTPRMQTDDCKAKGDCCALCMGGGGAAGAAFQPSVPSARKERCEPQPWGAEVLFLFLFFKSIKEKRRTSEHLRALEYLRRMCEIAAQRRRKTKSASSAAVDKTVPVQVTEGDAPTRVHRRRIPAGRRHSLAPRGHCAPSPFFKDSI